MINNFIIKSYFYCITIGQNKITWFVINPGIDSWAESKRTYWPVRKYSRAVWHENEINDENVLTSRRFQGLNLSFSRSYHQRYLSNNDCNFLYKLNKGNDVIDVKPINDVISIMTLGAKTYFDQIVLLERWYIFFKNINSIKIN